MIYLTNTFSPLMLDEGVWASVKEIDIGDIPPVTSMTSAISHEVTASVISTILNGAVAFNRVNLKLIPGDVVFCVVPSFRAEVAREFTKEEVESAPIRTFRIECFRR